MATVTIELPSPPTLNTYWRRILVRGQARTTLSAAGRAYKERVWLLCQVAKVHPLRVPVKVTIRWRRPKRIGDLDNHFKAVLDAVRGCCFVDDSQVVELHAYRSDDKTHPGVTLTVEPA